MDGVFWEDKGRFQGVSNDTYLTLIVDYLLLREFVL